MDTQDPQKQKDFLRKYQNVNRKMEEEQAAAKALVFNLPYIDLSNFPLDLNSLAVLKKQEAEDSRTAVFYKEGNDVRVATTDPHNLLWKQFASKLEREHKYKIEQYYVSQSSFDQLLKSFDRLMTPPATTDESIEINKSENYQDKLEEIGNNTGKTFTATKVLEAIFGRASQMQASDIHLEPEENIVKLRFRLDGVLSDILHLPKAYQKPLISRLKILSKLKLNVENLPQDGRFTFISDSAPIDVRVSMLPSAYGEGTVMRILGTSAVSLHLEDLGMVGQVYDIIQEELQKPNGMIVTTGPTGSGKTTTLYAFLNNLNEPGVKIITLEDPVEYKLEGISQTPISGGLTFASGLRSILRQDPDVVMVGEIRDPETAETALQAALTGHIVLSTLHTNDAAGAIPRLFSMGIKPYMIAPAINAIIAQRLVRVLCTNCKKVAPLDPFMLEKVKKILADIPKTAKVEIPTNLEFYSAPGCEKCNVTGYKGRIGIYEVIQKSEWLDKLILSDAGISEIKKEAIAHGMITMMQDGLLKALKGITDVEEVFRVTIE